MASKRPPTYDASDGLHKLKEKCKNKSAILPLSKFLTSKDNLEDAIRATYQAAQERRKSFRLDREPPKNPDVNERFWEKGLYLKWGKGNDKKRRVPGCWTHLTSYQVPLFDKGEKQNWGAVDLLGYLNQSGKCFPVILELKSEPPPSNSNGLTANMSETPLRMVLEAAAYAVALRKNWNIRFRDEFIARVGALGIPPDSVPKKLNKVFLVAIAPAGYWLEWLPYTEKGRSKVLSKATWQAFNRLLKQFRHHHLPVSFVSISGSPQFPDSLAAQPLVGFPPLVESARNK